jgi:parvulin-like peptidyl-prolyl isomerase
MRFSNFLRVFHVFVVAGVLSLFSLTTANTPVIQVGPNVITQERIDSLTFLLAQRQAPNQPLPPEQRGYLSRMVASNLIGQELVQLEVQRLQITAQKKSVDSLFALFKSNFPNPQDFQEALQRSGQTEQQLREKISLEVRSQELLKQELSTLEQPTEASMKAFFTENKAKFPVNDTLRASQIVLQSTGPSQREQLEKIRKGLDTIPDLDKRVELFLRLASQTQTPNAKRGGDLGPFKRGDFLPAFDKAIESLNVGDVSQVFETPLGTHLVLMTVKNDGQYRNYRLQIMQILIEEQSAKNQEALQKYLQKLADRHKVTYLNPEYRGDISNSLNLK